VTVPVTTGSDRPQTERASLTVPQGELCRLLTDRVLEGASLKSRVVKTPSEARSFLANFHSWDEYNRDLLRRSLTTSDLADQYSESDVGTRSSAGSVGEEYRVALVAVDEKIRKLRSVVSRLDLYDAIDTRRRVHRDIDRPTVGDAVFVVHGRNLSVRDSVARFIQQVGEYDPIILQEQPNSGQTVIEKFEQHAATAAFAVVLLTGDDEGSARGGVGTRVRARQNVIFELGYFVGALGRSRVAALYEEEVELPSDVNGMLYTSLAQDWKLQLGREMRAAGLRVDLNCARG